MKKSLVIGALVAGVVGCSQPSQSPVGQESSALSGVQNCQAQAKTCASTATSATAIAACEQQLKSCLEALIDDAGLPPVGLGSFDAGSLPSPGSFFDGSLPPVGSFDGGGGALPILDDAGFLPIFDDAGLPPITFPFDAGSVSACIQSLQSCLSSSTSPQTCATQVATCLEQAI
ncbi:MAG: hypothetical protein ACLQVI_30745 [Polyangiaceae bacterium]|jgi:hypothetical protein